METASPERGDNSIGTNLSILLALPLSELLAVVLHLSDETHSSLLH